MSKQTVPAMLAEQQKVLEAITKTLSSIADKTDLIHEDTKAIRQDAKDILTHIQSIELEGVSSEVVEGFIAAYLVEEGTIEEGTKGGCLVRSELSSHFRDYMQNEHKDIYAMKKDSILNTNKRAGTFLCEMLNLMGFKGYHHHYYGRKDVIVGWKLNDNVAQKKPARNAGKKKVSRTQDVIVHHL